MKKKTGVFIFVCLAVMVMGGIQPALLYSYETPAGDPWDSLIDNVSFTGTKWSGPLSVYFDADGIGWGYMYATVRLSHQGVEPYAYYGRSTQIVEYGDATLADELHIFLNNALSYIYGTAKTWKPGGAGDWKLKSIQNAVYLQGADGKAGFVCDIQITVK